MINTSAMKFSKSPSSKLVIVSYSPTGGGHTARLLNIINLAVENKALPADSIVVLHVPCIWEGTPRPSLISTLAKTLLNNNIHVWMAESDKSIYGYLNKETGGSDDAKILQHITHFPLRNISDMKLAKTSSENIITDLSKCVYFQENTNCSHLPVISAKDLMQGLASTFGRNVIAERCYLLTDMDPYLQKAAEAAGLPGKRRLDQQNHAILLNLNDAELNLLPKYALLSKVLGGYGENISHIDLGGQNTLSSLIKITSDLKIFSGTPKYIARTKVADLLMSYALNKESIKTQLGNINKPFSGVIAGASVKYGGDARNIIYVYAHKKTNLIARCVYEKIQENNPEFQQVIFLFCGADAVGPYNAMHLAYIADADGITTAGAGTVGEYTYLRKQAGCASRLLVLPIEGHNEQEKNASVITEDADIRSFIVRTLKAEELSESLQRFVIAAPKTVQAPYTMNEFISAVSDPNSYVKQAYDLLFTTNSSIDFRDIRQVEQLMNKNPLLQATRKYLKLVFQSLDITERNTTERIQVSLQQGLFHTFPHVEALNNTLQSPNLLANIIGLNTREHVSQLPLLKAVQTHFSSLANGSKPSKDKTEKLKEEFGEFMVTGF